MIFFDVGGNSLSAIRLITCIQDKFEISLPARRIFEFPSISELAPQVDLARFLRKKILIWNTEND